MTYKPAPPQCPECGEEFAPNDCRDVAPPEDSEDTSPEDMWLLDEGCMNPPRREWTCRECGTVTNTIEVTIEFIHRISAESSDKAEYINENYGRKNQSWINRPRKPKHLQVVASIELAFIVGAEAQDREQAVKKFWEYVSLHGLQDPANMRMINADDLLRPVFGSATISMFDISDVFERHLNTPNL